MKHNGKAAIFVGPKEKMQVKEYGTSFPKQDEILLKLKRSGICGTDVHILNGRLKVPFKNIILGHEFIGEVIEAGKGVQKDGVGNKLKIGDTVIACVAVACGKCFLCKKGETSSCLNFGVSYFRNAENPPHFFGGYAEYLYTPAKLTVKVPNNINLDAVAAFPCAGPTCIRAFEYAGGLKPGELVVVQGTGPVGLFAISWAVKKGCNIVAVGSSSNPRRMELARKLGALEVLDYKNTSKEERHEFVTEMASKMKLGNGADVVFEASGSPQAIPEGIDLLRTRGRYIIPGQYSDSGNIEIQPNLITFKAIMLIGSGQYTLRDIKEYIDFVKKSKDVQETFASVITHRWKLEEANEALETALKGESIKGVFISAD